VVERKFAHPELRGASLQEALDLQRREAGKESGQDQAIREWLEFKRKTAGWTLKPEKVFVDASYEAMVAEENRRLINLQQASIRETQKATKIIEAGRKLARLWGPMAGELLLEGNIQTYREFLKLVASVQYEANHMLGRGLRQYSLRFRDSLSRMEFYENVVSQLGKTGFTLWVKESGVFPSYIDSNGQVHSMENPARMREYAKKLNEEAQIAIEYAFIDTLHECTEIAGANPIAWPQAYTDMLRRRVNYVLKKGLLFGEYNQNMGPSMSGWSLSVDFNKLFGHQGYLDVAVHYQAMIGEEVDSRGNLLSLTNWKGPFKMRNTDKRVESLPYSGQKLLNSPGKRYLFWYAMATKKRMFYGGYKNLQQAQRGRKKRWPSAIERNQARLDKLQTEYDSTSHKSGLTMAEALSEDKVRIKRDMNDLYKRNRYLKENINEKPKGIPIPRNAWEITIAKRVAYWEQHHVAPVWWYLEFGQLRWNPKIPPLGF
jgi:hypothetical protein